MLYVLVLRELLVSLFAQTFTQLPLLLRKKVLTYTILPCSCHSMSKLFKTSQSHSISKLLKYKQNDNI